MTTAVLVVFLIVFLLFFLAGSSSKWARRIAWGIIVTLIPLFAIIYIAMGPR
jgi:hypothetical protein